MRFICFYYLGSFLTALLLTIPNIPHLIGQKMGKIPPSPRIVYVLFTKADFANKKMRLSAHIKEGWALYARPIELLIFVLAQ